MDKDITKKYIFKHKTTIIKWMEIIINELKRRAIAHDNSKLKEPEISGWRKMDKESRHPYGSKEYFEKLKKYKNLLMEHWRKNRHHPEYWKINSLENDRDLLDVIEMLIDWLSYKNDLLSLKDSLDIVSKQTKRYHFSEELTELIKNTVINYFSFPGGIEVKNIIEKQRNESENFSKDITEIFDSRSKKYNQKENHLLDIEV